MRIVSFDVGPFKLDGGSIFGVVPKEKWGRYFPVDEKNRIQLALNVVLVDLGKRKFLIDSGSLNSTTKLLQSLESFGVSPQEITDIVFTHLHFDHCGGCFETNSDGVKPIFKNATYYLSETELENALFPDERTRHFYHEGIARYLSRCGMTKRIEASFSPEKEIEIVSAPGHTEGHCVVKVYSDKLHFIAGDMFPTLYHFEKPYFMTAFDENLRQNLKTKKRFMEEIYSRKSVVYFYHHKETPFIEI